MPIQKKILIFILITLLSSNVFAFYVYDVGFDHDNNVCHGLFEDLPLANKAFSEWLSNVSRCEGNYDSKHGVEWFNFVPREDAETVAGMDPSGAIILDGPYILI